MRVLLIVFSFLGTTCAACWAGVGSETGELREQVDPDTGLTEWHWKGERLAVELAQLLPDQTRAFFMGRGFERPDADRIAHGCVFQSIIRNAGAEAAVSLDLSRWRTRSGAKERPLRLNRDWQAVWEERAVPEASRIAFRWALFPTEHEFEPGDWLMGMIAFDRPPGETFDLRLRWREDGEVREAQIGGVACAPDVSDLRSSGDE